MIYSIILLLCVAIFWFLVSHNAVMYIGCPFKTLTGIPCPTCGITRMSFAFFHLHIWEAITFNPLIAICLMLVPAWGVHDLLVILHRIKPIVISRKWLRWGLTVFLALNWAYLIIFKI